jgi:capsular exopolysaccharide synthesis family protein
MASEGKTSTVVNLGTVLADAGQRVVMVDLDLRRPRLHETLQLSNTVGFTSVFLGEASLTDATQQVSGEDSLFLLPSGRTPVNPSEVLASKRTSELLFKLQSSFDVVLIDSAPILPVTDAIVLTAWVEATLIVARAGVTTRKQLTDAVGLLGQVGASVAGTVLNQATPEAGYGYGYGENHHRPGVHGGPAQILSRMRRVNTPAESHRT